MKQLPLLLFLAIVSFSCGNNVENSSLDPVNWEKRTVKYPLADTLTEGTTYLSVYSTIYSQTEHRTHGLTATISLRNTDPADTVFMAKAEYFDTHGKLIRTYFEQPIFIAPMETVEIVIDEVDQEGGSGGNFLFHWKTRETSNEPLFEGVMISTSGQQGLSFTTQGKRIK